MFKFLTNVLNIKFRMWAHDEIEKMRRIIVDDVSVEDFLDETEIDVIKGLEDGVYSNITRYKNLYNSIIVPKLKPKVVYYKYFYLLNFMFSNSL